MLTKYITGFNTQKLRISATECICECRMIIGKTAFIFLQIMTGQILVIFVSHQRALLAAEIIQRR
jgi:hypothetical protein